ncbi:MAG: hypothetical protein U0L22_06370 [Bacteroidales bacterium]|nr:hypothetical protein [Bacteroidales bacterium]
MPKKAVFSCVFSLISELKNLDLIFSISEIEISIPALEISKRALEKIKADLAKIKPDFRQFLQDFFEINPKENFPK